MSLLQQFIDCDQQLNSIFTFLDNNYHLIRNNRSGVNLQVYHSKFSVFEENGKIFKVYSTKTFKKCQAISYLIYDLLELQDIILPFDIEYEGKYLSIISQRKLHEVNRLTLSESINGKKIDNLINNKFLNNDINQFLAINFSRSLYEKFIDVIDFLKVMDLTGLENFGMEDNNFIKCIDFESFNTNISSIELKNFLNKYQIDFGQAINQCPYLLNFITA